MKANPSFTGLPKSFWAYVRIIGQECGYSVWGKGRILVPTREKVESKMAKIGISTISFDEVMPNGVSLWVKLNEYFEYRAEALHNHVEPCLMDAESAEKEYISLRDSLNPRCPQPFNKQKEEKRAPAYFTCMINMLIEDALQDHECDYDPRALTTVTRDGLPLRAFSRRMDGAFPSVVNPIAVWEIKEYYYTTTFGSRVAGGVYETLLDGMEIEELAQSENIDILHYLMIDAYYTWWKCGRSYLCRIVDMLHMGYVDEVLVGKEIISRLPVLVNEWVKRKK